MLFNKFSLKAQTVNNVNNRLFTWGLNNAGQLGYNGAPTSFAQISSGQSHTLAITNTGLLYAWGFNTSGQLGDNTAVTKSSPVLVSGSITNWKQAAAGDTFSVGVTSDGKIYTWGNNAQSQLGNVATINRSVPVQILTSSSWTQVTAGSSHALAISTNGALFGWGAAASGQVGLITNTAQSWSQVSVGPSHIVAIRNNGQLFTWGLNSAGQLGDVSAITKSSPVLIGTNTWTKITTGNNYTLAIRSDGALFGWGLNTGYQLGDNTATNRNSPVQILSGTSFTDVSAGFDHTFAIRNDGLLFGWGTNNAGQLGLNDTLHRSSPVQIGSNSWSSISSGQSFTIGRNTDGTVFTWGLGTTGQLGTSDIISRSSPVYVLSSAVQISAGQTHSVVIDSAGALFTWGTNTLGQLGDGTVVAKSSPTQITGSWTNASAGTINTIAQRSDGLIFAWGQGLFGSVGDSTSVDRSSPVQIGSSSWTSVSTKGSTTAAIASDNRLYVWGLANNGLLGDVTTVTKSSPVILGNNPIGASSPIQIQSAGRQDSWSQISAANNYTLGIDSSFRLWAWGDNSFGRLGDSTIDGKNSPTLIDSNQSWLSISAGVNHALALTYSNSLYGWGLNSTGQLGDLTNISKSSPTLISGSIAFQKISAGNNASASISMDNKLYVWGNNSTSLLGLLTDTIARSSPTQLGNNSWNQISIGGTQTVGILFDRTLYAWGTNTNGVLGDNTAITKSSPILITATALINYSSPVQLGALSWSKISSSLSHTLAVRSDGLLFGWGLNSSGQLGQLTDTIARSSPVLIGIGSSWKFVAAGAAHSLAVRSDDLLYAWGLNNAGQLGISTDTIARSSPVLVTAFNWTRINAGASHSVGTTSDNSLYTWGLNSSGQLGITSANAGGDTINRSAPSQVSIGTNYYSISAGQNYTVAIDTNYNLYAWGLNSSYQLGDTTTLARSSPVLISASSWSQVSAGTDHTLAIALDGTLWSWGSNTLGQLGAYTLVQSWTQVVEGNSFTAAIRSDGLLFTWGLNTSGQLGTGDTLNRSSPVQIGTNSWNQVFIGSSHMGVIDAVGNAYIWGNNNSGQLGDGTQASKSSPVQLSGTWNSIVPGIDHTIGLDLNGYLYTWGTGAGGQLAQYTTPYSWSQVAEGLSHTIAIRNDGLLFGWGLNTSGQLGVNDIINRSSPVQIGANQWSKVATGASHTLAIRNDGVLFAWGVNSSNQLGDSTTLNRSSPVQIGTSSWSQITAGASHSLALDSNNLLFAWGRGVEGQLGLLTTSQSWSELSAGGTHASGILSNGQLFTWGLNSSGQLGLLADTIARSSPVQIGTSSWTSVDNGATHSLAIRRDGILFAWGLNASGQLGTGTDTLTRSSPVQIGSLSWSSVSGGNSFTLGISNNRLYAWGLGGTGQLGDGTLVSKSSPVQVGLSSWVQVSAGFDHAVGIDSSGRLFVWGNPTTINIQVEPQSWTAIDSGVGSSHVLAIRSDGILFTWGSNVGGQLGTGDTLVRSSPVQIGSSSWTTVSAGTSFSTALDANNRLFVWGLNSSGQLGITTDAVSRSSPVLVAGSWIQAVAGSDYVVARKNDSTLYSWGNNNLYQLGLGTTVLRSSPVQIGTNSWTTVSVGLDHTLGIDITGKLYAWGNPNAIFNLTDIYSWTQVSVGGNYALAIRNDGLLFAWGQNNLGGLGDGTTIDKSSPVQIGSGSWTSVNAHLDHSLAINTIGQVFAWGNNAAGQLGDNTSISKSSPVQLNSNLSFSQVASGNSFSTAITNTGLLYTWGLNASSQVGDGTTVNKSNPVLISSSSWLTVSAGTTHAVAIDTTNNIYGWGSFLTYTTPRSWTQISEGPSHVLAIRQDGLLFAWGTNTAGQLGDNTSISKSSPVQIGTNSWSSVSAGTDHSLAIDITGKLYAWGGGASMQTGLGGTVTASTETLSRSSPIQIGTASSWSQISAGNSYSFARTTTSLLFGWGLNTSSQLGLGNTIARSSPVQIGTSSWSTVSSGFDHVLGIDSNNNLYTWGNSSATFILTNNFSWTQISEGGSHVLAIRSDGLLFAWGGNASGQLGDNTAVLKSSPVQIGTGSWSSVSAGLDHSLAINTLGQLFTWGAGAIMQTGLGGTVTAGQETLARSSPIQIGTASSWSQISAGTSYSLARTNTNLLFAWGLNASNQLGDGTTIAKSSPVQIGSSSWNTISAGFDHNLGIDSNNNLYAWGNSTAISVMANQFSWTQVSEGGSHVLAIRSDGLLFAWGGNASGQLGDNSAVLKSSPVQIGTGSWSQVSAGLDHSLAINTLGQLFTWGAGASMQTGLGGVVTAGQETLARSSPIQIGTANSWSQVSAGTSYSLARTTTSLLYGWGLNASNQLGDNTTIAKSSPIQIGSLSWNTISAGFDHSLGIDNATQNLYTWGNAAAGGALTPLFSWTQLSDGGNHVLAIRNDGLLFGWGLNSSGQLGLGTDTIARSSPVQIGTGSWSQIAAGDSHSIAVNTLGQLFGWGLNASGQLGLTTDTIARSSPVQISTTLSWSQIRATVSYSMGITNTNLLYAWGLNTSGQLGDGTLVTKSSPVQIGSSSWNIVDSGFDHTLGIDSNNNLYAWGNSTAISMMTSQFSWTQLSDGGTHVLAIRNDGLLFAWGNNANGQIGDNTSVNKSSPVQIGTGSWSQVSAGLDHSLAINTLGKLFTWGGAAAMQTGLGGTVTATTETLSRSSPIQIGTANSWSQVSAGTSYSLARTTTSLLFGWGLNSQSQLGDGTTIAKSSPIQIGTTSWSQISAGFDHSLGIDSTTNNLYAWGNPSAATVLTLQFSWSQVSNGGQHILAIRNDGLLFAWGLGTGGQLGDNTSITKSSPVQIGTGSWSQVSAGLDHSLAINTSGQLFTWGAAASMQTGLGGTVTAGQETLSRSSPIQIGTANSWSQVSAGVSYSIARTTTSLLYGWGLNSQAQLGLGNTIARSQPVQIGTSSWTTISAGFDHTLGIDINSNLYAWGNPNAVLHVTTSNSWTQVSDGGNHTLAIRNDGTLWAWGLNSAGQLGLTTDTIARSSPVQIGTGSWSQVSAGDSHSLAINTLGQMFGWGLNASGQLGLTTDTIARSSPIQIATGTSWSSVSAGISYSLARRNDSTLFAWGINTLYQLGNGTSISRSSPVVVASGTSWNQVNAGFDHSLGIDSLGNMYAWGNGAAHMVPTTLFSWTQVSMGASHVVAIRNDGLLFTWGFGNQGQLGDGTSITKSSPVQVGTSSWTSVSAGQEHNLAIDINGKLYAWGSNTLGQLGLGTDTIARSSPVQVAVGTSWSGITAGSSYSLGITNLGSLRAWGLNAVYQLGDGTSVNKSSPVTIGSSSWTQVDAGFDHNLGIDSTGKLYVWGNGLGASTATNIFSWTQVSIGTSHTIAIRSDGLLFTWGIGTSGQLGDLTAISKSSPVQVGSSSWSQVSAGDAHTLAIDTTGKLYGWGLNASGQLGLTTDVVSRSSPVQIAAGTSWSSISAAGSFTLARTTANSLFAWGLNSLGQLGDGTVVNKSSPVQIAGTWSKQSAGIDHSLAIDSLGNLYTWGNPLATNVTAIQYSWTQVSEGPTHTLAIRNDGLLFTWGSNATGQLGDNTSVSKSSPVQVGSSSWSQVSAGFDHSLAIDINGKLYAWGGAAAMQTGLGGVVTATQETLSRSSPIQIGTANSWSQISAGSSYSLARTTTNLLFGWGLNTLSQLGDGTAVNKSSPVQIGSSTWTTVSSGLDHALGVDSNNNLYAWGNPLAMAFTAVQNSWTQVSEGASHILAVRSDGTLWGWGLGTSGQLGDGTSITKSSPVQIGSGTNWSQAIAGVDSSAAITTTGALFMWGLNASGQLGLTTDTIARSSPVQVATGTSWSQLSIGASFTIGKRTDNTLWTWGLNTAGQMGDGTLISKSSPVQVNGKLAAGTTVTSWNNISAGFDHSVATDALTGQLYVWGNATAIVSQPSIFSWTKISSGSNFTVAIRNDGLLFTWGVNAVGQIGDGTTITKSSPVQIGNSSWNNVSAGFDTAYAIDSTNKLYAWGSNAGGQLADNTSINKSSPVLVTAVGTQSWTQVAGGQSFAQAIQSDATLWAFGLNSNGQLGLSVNTIARSVPVQVGTLSWSFVAAGGTNAAGIRTDGTIFAWGNNAVAQLGDNTTVNKSSPVLVTGGGTPSATVPGSWTQVAVGISSMVAIKDVGTIFAWGLNSSGQLGDGTTVNKSSPVLVTGGLAASGTVPGSWTQVRANVDGHISAIKADSTLWGWGLNNAGQLGIGTDTLARSSPIQVSGGGSWSAISAGSSFTTAIKTDGTMFAWGLGTSILVDGTTVARSSPVLVRGTTFYTAVTSPTYIHAGQSYTRVAAGQSYSLAIRNDSTMWGWGLNNLGQLGDNSSITKSTPVQVNTGLIASWSQVKASNSTAFAIATTNLLYGWGQQAIGQLNIGGTGTDTLARSAPVAIGSSSWSQVSAWASSVAAIRSDGIMFAWGLNSSGQTGDLTAVNKSSPVLVRSLHMTTTPYLIPTGSSWTSVSAGTSSSAAIRLDSTLWTWGLNNSGQLGINSAISQSSPVQLSVGGSWTQVRIGSSTVLAIRNDGGLYGWGLNSSGQTGLGIDTIARSAAVQIGTSTWTSIAVGGSTSTAIRSDNILFAWGNNAQGQIGDLTAVNKSSPVLVRSLQLSISPYLIPTGFSWSQVSAGFSHNTAIRTTGELFTWGLNNQGQLGDNTTINKSSPVQVTGGGSWTSISAGNSYTMAINSLNLLFGWGLNTTGQLGTTDAVSRSNPLQIGTSSWTQVSASNNPNGSATVAVRSDNLLFATGYSTYGQLGDMTAVHKSSPILVRSANFSTTPYQITHTGIPVSWSVVGAGTSYNAAIASDGTLWTWGLGTTGQLGDNTAITRSTLAQVSGGGSWTSVNIGNSFAAAINNLGLLYTWGQNSAGQLGTNDAIVRSAPIQIGTSSWTQASVGNQTWNSTLMAIRSDGLLFGSGYGPSGQLGDMTAITKSSPTLVRSATYSSSPILVTTGSWSQVAAGQSFSAAIRQDNTLWTWGLNNLGQLGDGTSIIRSTLAQISVGGSWSQVRTANSTAFAISSTNLLYGWGQQAVGQLNIGGTGTDTLARSVAVQIGTSSWSSVSANITGVAAIRSDGILFTWGNNASGQMGDLTVVTKSSPTIVSNVNQNTILSPVLLPTGASWSAVSAGQSVSLALRTDSTLYAWGLNNLGQVGTNDIANRSSPSLVTGGGSFSQIKAANSTAFAVSTTGALFGWGQQAIGQLNIGGTGTDTLARSSPVQIGSSSWSQVSAWGSGVTAIFASDKNLYAWGLNTNGLTGDNTAVTKSSPVQVRNIALTASTPVIIQTSNSWSSVSAGQSYSLAIRNDSTLWAWGLNNLGQLSTNDSFNRSFASQINVGGSWSQIKAGNSTAFGIRTTGALFGWGQNTVGQLNIGGTGTDTLARSSAVQIGTSSWSQVSVWASGISAIRSDNVIFTWGLGTSGQLGENTAVTKSSPVLVRSINLNTTSPTLVQALTGGSWTSVSAGQSYSLAIRNDNTLWTWGLNTLGQLASNDIITRSSPTQISIGGSWSQITAANSTAFAISNTGLLYGWGQQAVGQLNIGGTGTDTLARSAAVQIGSSSWSQVAAWASSIVATRSDNILFAWGLGTNGTIGDNTTVTKSSPTQVRSLSATAPTPTIISTGQSWVAVSAGQSYSAAIRQDNTIWTWGLNNLGQLATNDVITRSSPTQISIGGSWTSIKTANSTAFAISSTGALYGWGQQAIGQLNIGGTGTDTLARSAAVQIGSSSWSQVAAWASNVSAIRNDGILYAWGLNSSGQIGDYTTVTKSSPVFVRSLNLTTTSPVLITTIGGGINSWSTVSAGQSYSLAIRNDGLLFAWGLNTLGQLASNDIITRSSPTQISIGGSWSSVKAANSTAFAINNLGLLYGWGQQAVGQLNIGGTGTDTLARSAAVQIGSSSWSQVAIWASNVSAIRNDGILFAWGLNSSGQTGDLTAVTKSSPVIVRGVNLNTTSPVFVQTVGLSWSQVSAGTSYSTAISSNNLLYTWGINNTGQLGQQTVWVTAPASVSSPTQIGALSYSAISAGPSHAMAIDSTGKLFGWGLNSTGQLGLGTDTIARSSPTQIGTSSWTSVSAGNSATIGISSDNNLYAWGNNAVGNTGDLTVVVKSSPVLVRSTNTITNSPTIVPFVSPGVATGPSYVSVSAGNSFTAAIRNDGTLWLWGVNNVGQLGIFTDTLTRSSPVQISGGGSWSQVYAGSSFVTGLKSDNTLYVWGSNAGGSLGTGDTITRSSPVQIGTSSWSQVSAGGSYVVGIKNDKTMFAWGASANGQMGESQNIPRSSPVIVNGINYNTVSPVVIGTVVGISNSSWTQVSAGVSYNAVIKPDNTLYTWGLNNAGQLGLSDTINRSSPTQVTSIISWNSVSAGNSYTLGLSGTNLYGWGLNSSGQLGLATDTIARSTPVQVPGSFTSVTSGNALSIAIRSDNTAFMWGINTNYTLGINTTIARSSPIQLGGGQILNTYTNSPVQVKVGDSFSQISAGSSFTYAIRNDGTLWAWGLNSAYQLGLNNDSIARSSPVQIGSSNNWTSVSAGLSHGAAINSLSQLWTFGAVTPINNTSPVQITAGTGSFSQVSAGQSYTLARDINGILYAWGQDTSGQLGYF